MAALFNGAECGPVNPLKNFSSRLEQDRGAQLDRNVAGPSRQQAPFRALPATQAPFRPQNVQQQQAFNLGSLERALSPQQANAPQVAPWAQDYSLVQEQQAREYQLREAEVQRAWLQDQQMHLQIEHARQAKSQLSRGGWAADFDVLQADSKGAPQCTQPRAVQQQHRQQTPYQPMFQPQTIMSHQPHHEQVFHPHPEQITFPPELDSQREMSAPTKDTELSSAATSLLTALASNAQAAANPKLANSQFMQLMKDFASGEKSVEGDKVQMGSSSAAKGKGKASARLGSGSSGWADEFERSLQTSLGRAGTNTQMGEMNPSIAHMGPGVPSTLEEALNFKATSVPGTMANWEDTTFDTDELETFLHFNGQNSVDANKQRPQQEWDQLQDDWDTFEHGVGAVGGVRQVEGLENGRYLFQSRNPHFRMAESALMSDMEASYRGLLEHEAAVQANPRDTSAWYNLGLKQQENEQDDAAILALSKVVQLDPSHQPAQLALAVSYTNEGQHEAAQTSLEEWARLGDENFKIGTQATGYKERHQVLIDKMLEMARMMPEGEIDADVQVVLGVLFNTTSEYDKAKDCLAAALAVRPDDWLLWNRIGATAANGGDAAGAMEYYHRALALHPSFVRALYNMGIAHNALGQYEEGARRVLDALRLQQADATEAYSSADRPRGVKGVTSSTLWECLRTACLRLGRQDLMEKCTDKDLAAFNDEFIEAA